MRGPSDLHWKYKELTAKLGEEVSEFSVAPSGYHVSNAPNAFALFPKPKLRMPLYKYIVLADMPYKPIPDYVVKHILNSVKNGGKLIILGGYFTLQKGGYVGTEFEPILPVSIKDRWKEVTALPDAKVFQFNGKDAVIYKPYGKGMVYVLPGNPVQDTTLPDVYNHFTF